MSADSAGERLDELELLVENLQGQVDALRDQLLRTEAAAITFGHHRIYCAACERTTPAYRGSRYARWWPAEICCWDCGGHYTNVTIRDRFRLHLTASDRWRWKQRLDELADEQKFELTVRGAIQGQGE